MTSTFHLPAGTAASPLRGGGHTGVGRLGLFVVADRLLVPTGTHRFDTGDDEVIVLPLRGAVAVETDGSCLQLSGRENVFAGPTDLAYIESARPSPCGPQMAAGSRSVCSRGAGAAGALCARRRGSGGATRRRPSSRQVRNFGTPGALEASRSSPAR